MNSKIGRFFRFGVMMKVWCRRLGFKAFATLDVADVDAGDQHRDAASDR